MKFAGVAFRFAYITAYELSKLYLVFHFVRKYW